jgi:hypothetical protein
VWALDAEAKEALLAALAEPHGTPAKTEITAEYLQLRRWA